MTLSDAQLDARLRDLSEPAHLGEQLHAIPMDDELESWLTESDAPAGFAGRLHSHVWEMVLAEQLGAAPGVRDVIARLHNQPYRDRARTRRAWGWATGIAASALAIAVQAASWMGAVHLAQPPRSPGEMEIVLDLGPLEFTADPPPPALVYSPPLKETLVAQGPSLPLEIETPRLPNDVGGTSEVAQIASNAADWDMDTVLAKWSVFGARNDPEAVTPILEQIALTPTQGWEPPLVRGAYDRNFLLRERETPWLSPEQAVLARLRAPLTTSTESADRLWRMARLGRLPDANEIRVEEVVAAERFGYAEANVSDGPELHWFGGPTVFASNPSLSPRNAQLLQIGVSSGSGVSQLPPTHWTIAVDISSGMAWKDRLLGVRRTIARLMDSMREEDRFSLVVFREDAWLAAELVTRDQTEEVLDLLDGLDARGRSDMVGGVGLGLSAALEGGFRGERRLVVLSDGRTTWPATVSDAIVALYQDARESGVHWHWIEFGENGDRSLAMLQQLQSSGAAALQLRNARDAVWAMLADWRGRPMLAARDVRVSVRFEPKTVQIYRLVGHRPSAWSGLSEQTARVDLRTGEEATSLFEVLLRPEGPSRVATVSLTWVDPSDGKQRRAQHEITRADFSTTFADAAPALQYAALAAEAGEVLSRSVFAVNRNRTLREVLTEASAVDGQLAERDEFRRFVRWLRELEQIRQRRGD